MTNFIVYFIIVVYSLVILLLFVYSLAQTNLLINFLKAKKRNISSAEKFDFSNPEKIPFVTIQLPIFNEEYVIDRLLNAIVALDYPKEKLEIQVLDDSTDESMLKNKQLVANYYNKGINIKHLFRSNRIGYKAGALKEGLEIASGEFIAIFDADFVPNPNWLLETVPYFKNEKIGVVQTRWGHINRNYSILTQIQAFALDAHFTLEQIGRNAKKHCINFNGTAGIWRKTCIYNAGNWQSDTLTEDLDLSYRAQLKNWEFMYLQNIETPAEVPAIISAAKSQQFRWNKGGAENLIKNAKRVIQSTNLSVKSKIHAILHLLNSTMFLCVFVMSVLSVPILFIKNKFPQFEFFFNIMVFFITTTMLFFICYWHTYKYINKAKNRSIFKFIYLFFTFYTIVMGFAFHNTIAVLEGLFGKKSEFIRTPKLNIEFLKENWKKNRYISAKIPKITYIEGLLGLYFTFAFLAGFYLKDYSLMPFHFMLLTGYSYVFFQTIKSV